MDKEKVIEYVMNSPQNTNRAVLEGLLDSGESESKILHFIYDESTSTYSIDESEYYIIDEAKSAYSAENLNIQVYNSYYNRLIGALYTERGYMGHPNGFLDVALPSMTYTSSSGNPPKVTLTCVLYRIDSTDYSVKEYTNFSGSIAYNIE